MQIKRLIKKDDELIIVDGNSRDNTSKIVNRFRNIVDIFISEPDIDMTHALNKGVLLARGKYIKNLSDDDEIYPQAMEQAISVLETNKKVDILVCGGTKQNGINYSVFYLPDGIKYGKSIEDVIKYGACGAGFILRRKSLAISGLIPVGLAGDVNFIMRCIRSGLNVKFFRINLFNHPIYSHSVIIAKSEIHQHDFYKNLKNYVSLGFYYKYKIKMMLNSWPKYTEKMYDFLPFTKNILWLLRILYRKIRQKKLKVNPDNYNKLEQIITNKKYHWDGGFS